MTDRGSLFPKFSLPFNQANIKSVFKYSFGNAMNNYRRISSNSKILEKLICRHLSNHFYNILSKFHHGFSKDLGAQHYLLLMSDKWKMQLITKRFLKCLLHIHPLLHSIFTIYLLRSCLFNRNTRTSVFIVNFELISHLLLVFLLLTFSK